MLNNFILPFQTEDDGRLIPSTNSSTIIKNEFPSSSSSIKNLDDNNTKSSSSSSNSSLLTDYEKTKIKRPYTPPYYVRPGTYDILGKPSIEPLDPINPLEGIEYQYGKKRVYSPSTSQYNSMNCGIRKNIIVKIINNNGAVFAINGNYFLIVRDSSNLPLIEKLSNRTWQTYNGLARGCETDNSNIMFCACPIKKNDDTILQVGQIYTLVKSNSAVDIVVNQIFTNFNSQKIKHYWGYVSKI